jgi:UDP-N-acetylglucosamine 1-carboxyvinyltransferase
MMEVFRIQGGHSLSGKVRVSGSKNSSLPLFAACLLTSEECILENVPDLSDIRFMGEILTALGAEVEKLDSNKWRIQASSVEARAPYGLVRKMRASVCLLGPLVARLRRAEIPMPGGCVIGNRPIDLHIRALRGLGADVELSGGIVKVDGSQLKGSSIFIGGRHGSTVTGTANAVMTASLTPGKTVLEGCACEPEITDLCKMLISMGAHISGTGSHTLEIEGVKKLSGTRHSVIPDRIEGATYALAAAMTQGEISILGANCRHLGAFANLMHESGVDLNESEEGLHVRVSRGGLRPIEAITLPYPGFPTDLQAQTCALACITDGLSILTERVYPSRFMHLPELMRMGASISLEGSSAIIRGVKQLNGAPVMASDLRASAALILAGLSAKGETWVQRIYHLDRGYDSFESKLNSMGAKVQRLTEEDLPKSFLQATDT